MTQILHGDLLSLLGIVIVRGLEGGAAVIEPDGISTAEAFGTPFLKRRAQDTVYSGGDVPARRKKGLKVYD